MAKYKYMNMYKRCYGVNISALLTTGTKCSNCFAAGGTGIHRPIAVAKRKGDAKQSAQHGAEYKAKVAMKFSSST